jgi:hypothetical protein
MKIIGAGFGRTGTRSLQAALEQLGFGPCYHMTEVIKHLDHADVWMDAGRGRPVDWESILRDYPSGVDFPICNFYGELMERYPDAKVVLSVRDPDRWYESCIKTIHAINQDLPMRWMGHLLPRVGKISTMVNALVWNGTFGGRFRDKDHAIAVYHRHVEEVRRRVPADKLLVFDVKEGWEPLCRFLGVPIPGGIPFPHLNDTAEFQRRVRLVKALSWTMTLSPPLLLGALLLWRLRSPRGRAQG